MLHTCKADGKFVEKENYHNNVFRKNRQIELSPCKNWITFNIYWNCH